MAAIKFSPDLKNKYEYFITDQRDINQEVNNSNLFKISNKNEIGYIYKTIGFENNKYTGQIELEYFKQQIENGNDNSVDSEGDSLRAIDKLLSINNASFTVEYNLSGKEIKMDDFDSIVKLMKRDVNQPTSNNTSPINNANILSKEYFSRILRRQINILPEEPISPHSEWKIIDVFYLSDQIIPLNITYQIQKIENGKIYINSYCEINEKLKNRGNNLGEISGEYKGKIELDLKSGIVLKQEITTNLHTKASAAANFININVTDHFLMSGRIMSSD